MAELSCELTYQYSGSRLTGYCVDCPELPAIPAVPAQTIVNPRVGWNAGARSAVSRTGDCFVQFSFDTPLHGSVCGLTPRFIDADPANVKFGFYAYTDGALTKFSVVENGETVRAPALVDLNTAVFRIERRRDRVDYLLNGNTVHTSAKKEGGALLVVGLMYHSDDGIL